MKSLIVNTYQAGNLRMSAAFCVGLVLGVVISNMRQISTGNETLPPDSPDFTGWSRPFLNKGTLAPISNVIVFNKDLQMMLKRNMHHTEIV